MALADTSIVLTCYPEGALPPAQIEALPLRVLLVLSQPVDASPIFPEQARAELVHGLRALDQEDATSCTCSARPPSIHSSRPSPTAAIHLLIFYGHGAHDAQSRKACGRGCNDNPLDLICYRFVVAESIFLSPNCLHW